MTAVTVHKHRNNQVGVAYHAIVGGIENAIRTIAIDPCLTMPARRQLLDDLLVIIPTAERIVLVERLTTLGTAHRNAWDLDDEATAAARHNELANAALATATRVVLDASQAVARFAALMVTGGVS